LAECGQAMRRPAHEQPTAPRYFQPERLSACLPETNSRGRSKRPSGDRACSGHSLRFGAAHDGSVAHVGRRSKASGQLRSDAGLCPQHLKSGQNSLSSAIGGSIRAQSRRADRRNSLCLVSASAGYRAPWQWRRSGRAGARSRRQTPLLRRDSASAQWH
jgi:hypothetical protein